ncbi:hypothetical protein GCM10009798_02900 [Nocardioides panacihumi]|uniref:Uncharacterized protein n=1 Tax=Nocardioides panacihumi TaxID=400774 RepID=A0ABN2Q997_9ACTN
MRSSPDRWLPPHVSGWTLATTAAAVTTAAVAAAAPDVVGLPQIGAMDTVVAPVPALLAWVAALTATTAASEPCPEVFATVPRRAFAVNVARIVLTLAAFTVGAAAATGTRDLAVAGLSARTSMALCGEGLAVASVAGLRYGWLPMTAHLLAAATLGAANRPDLAGWAWIVSPEVGATQVVLSTLLFVIGMTAWTRRARTVLSQPA